MIQIDLTVLSADTLTALEGYLEVEITISEGKRKDETRLAEMNELQQFLQDVQNELTKR